MRPRVGEIGKKRRRSTCLSIRLKPDVKAPRFNSIRSFPFVLLNFQIRSFGANSDKNLFKLYWLCSINSVYFCTCLRGILKFLNCPNFDLPTSQSSSVSNSLNCRFCSRGRCRWLPGNVRTALRQWAYISCGTCVRNRINLSRGNYKEPYIRQPA